MEILCFLIMSFAARTHGGERNEGVSPMYYSGEEKWAKNLMHHHLLNMTAEILKDTKYKLNQAEKIQEEHRHSIGYDLGTIAAGILERFLLMLKLYRKYSSIPDLKEKKYSIEEMMNILAVIQGAYNEIILEKSMFFETLKAYEALDPDHVERGRMDRLKSKKPSWFSGNKYNFRRGIISVSYGNETEVPKYVDAMKNDFSPALYTRFGLISKEYDPFAVKKLISMQYNVTANGTRKGFLDWLFGWGRDEIWGWQPYANMDHKGQACLYMQVGYKNAIKEITHYYSMRALYTENKEYEIGYLTHEIIFRYQIMLELYHFIEKRYYKNLTSNVAPVSVMLYFYGNILEDSQAIIHLCNILHEVDRKFKYNSGIKKKYESAFKDSFDDSKQGSKRTLSKDELYERYLKMKKKDAAHRLRQAKKKRKMYLKFGITTKAVPKYQTKKSRYPLHYGWSLEDWPPKPKQE